MNLIYLALPILVSSQTCINEFFDFEDPNWTTLASASDSLEEFDFISELAPNHVSNKDGYMLLTMSSDLNRKSFRGGRVGFGAVFSTTELMQYGKITANIKAGSTGPGVVSVFKFETPNGVDISFSITGKSMTSVYTNYQTSRSQGLLNSEEKDLDTDLTEGYHEYTIDWQPSRLQFLVDGEVIRTVDEGDVGDNYPTDPSYVKFEIFDGGGLNQQYANWAGFPTSYRSGAVYKMYVDSLDIECYKEE